MNTVCLPKCPPDAPIPSAIRDRNEKRQSELHVYENSKREIKSGGSRRKKHELLIEGIMQKYHRVLLLQQQV